MGPEDDREMDEFAADLAGLTDAAARGDDDTLDDFSEALSADDQPPTTEQP